MTLDLFLRLLALFIVGGIGFGAARAGLTGGAVGLRALSNLAFLVFVPALLFRSMAKVDLAHLPWTLLLAFFAPLLLWSLLVRLGVARRDRDDVRALQDGPAASAVSAVTASFGNTVQVGLPFAAAMFGEAGLQLHIAIVSLHALVLLSAQTVLAEIALARAAARAAGAARPPLGAMLLTILRQSLIHPVTLPVLAGLGWNALGLPLPRLLDEVSGMLAQAGVPLCLALIGVSLAQYGLGERWRRSAAIAAMKLLLLPALVAASAVLVFRLDGLALSVLVLAAALPTGSNAMLFAQRYQVREAEASTVIVLSTAGFMLSAPLWLTLLDLWRRSGFSGLSAAAAG